MPITSQNLPTYRPYSNVQPFTVRDGATHLLQIEALIQWVREYVIPTLNGEVSELTASWEAQTIELIETWETLSAALIVQVGEASEGIEGHVTTAEAAAQAAATAQAAAEAARDLAESFASDAEEAGDEATTALFNNIASSFRIALDSTYATLASITGLQSDIDTLEADAVTLAGRVTTAESDIDTLETSTGTLATTLDGVSNDLGTLTTLTGSGRLSENSLNVKYRYFLKATDYGVVANGTTDDAAAFNSFLTTAASLGLGAILPANATVYINSTVTIPSGTKLNLNGCTILRGPSGSSFMFELLNKSNIEIWNGKLNGNKAAYSAPTEWRHNINLDNSHNINIHDLESNNAKGDGIYIGGTAANAHCNYVRLTNVICNGNHRQGLSIIGVNDFVAVACTFSNTAGTAPEAGVDVEPNRPDQTCTNIRFIACSMIGNAGHGYLEALQVGATAPQGNVTLVGCQLSQNLDSGIRLTSSKNFQMIGGNIFWNTKYGVFHDSNVVSNAKFSNVVMRANGGHGVAFTGAYSGLSFMGCTFEANGSQQVGDGLNIAPSSVSNNLMFIGNYSGQTPQRNGLTLSANAQNSHIVGNSYGGNSGTSRSGESAMALDLDKAETRVVTGAKGGNAALTSLLTILAAKGIIVNSTT